jgi:tetratricopeptide (TPR) repeat protein
LFALTTGEYDDAIRYVERWAKTQPDEDLSNELGWTYSLAGRGADGAMQNRRYLQRALRGLQQRPSGDAAAMELAYVARAYAFLDNRAESIKYASRAVTTLPSTGAVRQRPMVLLVSAAALGQVGELEAARARFRQLLDLQFEVKSRGLWCGPNTAPLRADPAFRAMMSEHGANVSIDPHRRETWPKQRSP